jgi:hypothetical protein
MASATLESRIAFLLKAQNSDGGWGYFPGQRSWLEPTAWAMLALTNRKEGGRSVESAFELIRLWQFSEGGCRPCQDVNAANWTTALWVTLHCVHGTLDTRLARAVEWMLESRGAEGSLIRRGIRWVTGEKDSFNAAYCGWSWWPGTSSWLEPTVHGLVALNKVAAAGIGGAAVRRRAREAERMLLDRRCADGAWNYGVREALGHPLPSYPETTALALLALPGCGDASVKAVIPKAVEMQAHARSPVARAWLKLALRLWNVPLEEDDASPVRRADVLLAAIEALAAPDGNHRLLTPEGRA